jgi:hypothetical protein
VLRTSWTEFEGKRCRRAALSANAAERVVFGEHLLDACFVEASAYAHDLCQLHLFSGLTSNRKRRVAPEKCCDQSDLDSSATISWPHTVHG